MTDDLERQIRNLWCNTGDLDRDEVTQLLLGLLGRIQALEGGDNDGCCAHGIHQDNACGACVPPRGTR